MTIISTAEATALGLDLAHPDSTITVQGVGGTEDIPGFTLPSLTVPLSDGGTLQFTNVPVYVLDAAPGVVDGILGMNLLNTASEMLFDPFDPSGPSLSLTFQTAPDRGLGDGGLSLFSLLAGQGTTVTPGSVGTGSSAASGTVASQGGDSHLPAVAAGAVGQQILIMVPNEAGSGLGPHATDTRSIPATTAAQTSQGPSTASVSAPPAQSLSPAQSPTSHAIGATDEDLAHPFEDAPFDAPMNGSAPLLAPETIPGTLPDGPTRGHRRSRCCRGGRATSASRKTIGSGPWPAWPSRRWPSPRGSAWRWCRRARPSGSPPSWVAATGPRPRRISIRPAGDDRRSGSRSTRSQPVPPQFLTLSRAGRATR